ncbi:MAG: pyridoxal phosphate-dependent aminotransferase [Desulfobacterota bacterium]|jgi:aminotransferase|nr:pyridoxal phosphate-dependent aminotransferase [Thermodesulfobacteriota bacterium]
MVERSVYKIVGGEEDLEGIAKRVARITVSAIKQMPVLASRVEGCISLGQGIPSFATPSFIREAVIEALRQNDAIGKYSLQPGLPALKEAVARRFQQTKGMAINPEKEVFISCGAMESIAAGISTIVERGDEVLIPSPNYSSHIEQVLFAEGIPVFVPLLEERGWKLDIEGFRKAITKKTKAIVVCNPMNPTGAVFSEGELRALAEIALERNLFVVADEAYDFLVYDHQPHFSLASIPELKSNLIACYSFSKMYCMTGWRVGYMVASGRLVDQVLKVHDAFAICAPTISQYAALAALQATNGKDGEGDRFIRELVSALASRKEITCSRLNRLSHLFSYEEPKGAYYVFPRIGLPGLSSVDLSLKLLYEAKVITVPGSGFGPTGEGHIRISFGADEKDLEKAFDRIEEWGIQYT